jgi:ubiquinone/menaquinone biosynthesis C-methylase UbiE
MRKRTGRLLKLPDSKDGIMRFYAFDVIRDEKLIHNKDHDELLDEDDIINGFIVNEEQKIIYPISNYIGVLLSKNDIDLNPHLALLKSYYPIIPSRYREFLDVTIESIMAAIDTSDGNWNRDEMRYYDKEVETDLLRNKMLESIKNIPVWRIMLPRKKFITDIIKADCQNSEILEIGCGNSRTVSNIFRPAEYKYNYIGTDISFNRLRVAKSAVPEGDFIQASALELPFHKESFNAIISFGMLHHLPRPEDAVKSCTELIRKNGYFCFHEPFTRPALNMPGTNTFKKIVSTYEHSEHDQKINLPEIGKILFDSGFVIVSSKKEISLLRAFIESIIKKVSRKMILTKSVIQFLAAADELFILSVGKISRRFGPGNIFMVTRKLK